ncbi:MAG: hypothetical protein Q8O61_18425 [Nocardioides sp.]|nr:hypothetical protein [Nocardioides sp.]
MTTPSEERPIDLGGVPAEEGIDPADAKKRVDVDPDEQVNRAELRGEDDLDLIEDDKD